MELTILTAASCLACPACLKKILEKNLEILSDEKNLYRSFAGMLLGTKKYYRPAGQRLVVLVG